ncbi:MAG TPA: hypothetical protein VJZ76_12760 [Thermoanaerobaculia bacterium]|nr:hypothetical protein [Thermoanaerobaculia bacterium]
MRRRGLLLAAFALLLAATASAQQRPIFDVDDFVDPRQHDGPVFISRLIAGVARNFVDDYRPLGKDAGFIELTNSFYRENLQFDYKHSEVRGENRAPDPVRCGCNPPLYFPTPPPPGATPAAPQPGSRDTLQVGFYRMELVGPADPPIALRTRFTFSRQKLTTHIRSFTTGELVEQRSGHDQSIGVDADTHFVFRGHDIWGSLVYARSSTSGTLAERRTQQEFAYVARPPGISLWRLLARATLTVGGVTNRGGTALNIVNPALEAFWHSHATRANVHLVWSPLSMRDGEGWRTHHQIALFVDRALYIR